MRIYSGHRWPPPQTQTTRMPGIRLPQGPAHVLTARFHGHPHSLSLRFGLRSTRGANDCFLARHSLSLRFGLQSTRGTNDCFLARHSLSLRFGLRSTRGTNDCFLARHSLSLRFGL